MSEDSTSSVNSPVTLGELLAATELFEPHSISIVVRRTDEYGHNEIIDDYVHHFIVTTHRNGLTEITLDVS